MSDIQINRSEHVAVAGKHEPAVATSAGRDPLTRAGGFSPRGVTERRWSAEEIMLLRTLWQDVTVPTDAIPGLLNDRTRKAMRQMVAILGLGKRPKKAVYSDGRPAPYAWTPEDDAVLRSLWHKMTRHDVAAKMERSAHSVSHRASLLRLGRSEFTRQLIAARAVKLLEEVQVKAGHFRYWRDEETAILRAHWPDIERIQRRTGRSQSAIERKAFKLQLPPKSGVRRENWACEPVSADEEELPVIFHERQPSIARNCLYCGRAFMAETRFLRLCSNCRSRSEGVI